MAVDRAAVSSSITREGGDVCSVAGAGHGMVRVAANACSVAGRGNIIVLVAGVAAGSGNCTTRVAGVTIAEGVAAGGGRFSIAARSKTNRSVMKRQGLSKQIVVQRGGYLLISV